MKHRYPLAIYAEAYAASLPALKHIVRELDEAIEIIQTIAPLRTYLRDRSIALVDREAALHIALSEATPQTRNLILLLANEDRLDELGALQQHVREAVARRDGKRYVHVETASALTAQQKKEIESIAKNRAGQPVEVEITHRPDLLAGLRMRIGDQLLDVSLSSRLAQLTQSLSL